MSILKKIRATADFYGKSNKLGPTGGKQVTMDNALAQRAAQQMRMGVARTKTPVKNPSVKQMIKKGK